MFIKGFKPFGNSERIFKPFGNPFGHVLASSTTLTCVTQHLAHVFGSKSGTKHRIQRCRKDFPKIPKGF